MTIEYEVGYDCEYWPVHRFKFPRDHELLFGSSGYIGGNYWPREEFWRWLNDQIGRDRWRWDSAYRVLEVSDEEHAMLIKLTYGGA